MELDFAEKMELEWRKWSVPGDMGTEIADEEEKMTEPRMDSSRSLCLLIFVSISSLLPGPQRVYPKFPNWYKPQVRVSSNLPWISFGRGFGDGWLQMWL